jgi:5'-nucleotidase
VKIGLFELCPQRPDLVVSGINGGLNAGINVLYSGTVAAAIEGAFFGITSIAVSLEFDEQAQYEKAAGIARHVIQQLLAKKGAEPNLFNINIPTRALLNSTKVRAVPMGVARYGEHFVKRIDPRGRPYFWATNDPPPEPEPYETDLTAVTRGDVTVTPLDFDLTKRTVLNQMQDWDLQLPEED